MKDFTMNFKKVRNVFLAALFTVVSAGAYAQADGINYQAVVRDGSGNLVKSQKVDLKFTISEGTTSIFSEEHKGINTTAQGLVNVVIGKGSKLSGNFSAIDWTNSKQENLKVAVDIGSGYVSMGKQDFQAVPYALNVPWEKSNTGTLIYNDTTINQGERVEINAIDLSSSNDLLSLGIPSNASNSAQFIEFERGSIPVARINSDGSAEFKNVEVDTLGASSTPAKGTLYNESMPMAWGYIGNLGTNNAATIISSFGIKSASFNNTSKEFKITLDNKWVGRPAIIITPVSRTSGDFAGTNVIATDSDNFRIYIRDGANPSTKKPSDFMVVVYGRSK